MTIEDFKLSEHGKQQAEMILDRFRAQLSKAANEIIEDSLASAYDDVAEWIESDSWANFRHHVLLDIAEGRRREFAEAYYSANSAVLKPLLDEELAAENKRLKFEIDCLKNQRRPF